jgi:hypothetical protein
VLPGNTPDATTVARIKDDLRGWKLGRAHIARRLLRMHSEANREELARGMGKYVLAVPMSAITEVKTEVLSRPGRYRTIEESLLAKEGVVGDGERRRRDIVCFNPKEAERQAKHRGPR